MKTKLKCKNCKRPRYFSNYPKLLKHAQASHPEVLSKSAQHEKESEETIQTWLRVNEA